MDAPVRDADLLAALRSHDEATFARLVDAHTPAMLRVARGYVASAAIAEEVVQDTWLALLTNLDVFEGRSTLRTWLFTVLITTAKRRGRRERTDVEVQLAAADTGATVAPTRFRDADDAYPGHWRTDEAPSPFPDSPEGSALRAELRGVARREIDKLPERQRVVVTMRDVLDMDAAEVSAHLTITAGNQRVLLHRGRAAVRQGLEDYLKEGR